MTRKNRFIKALFLATIVMGLFACSSGPVVQNIPNTSNTGDEIAKLDKDINMALGNQLDVLSPDNFKKAQGSLKDAKKSLEKQENATDTLHYVAQGRTYLKRADEFAQLSHTNIEEVITARQQAMQAGAPNFFSADFKKADESLSDATSDIEKNKLNTALENRSALQLKYLDLELKSIKQARLGQAREIIAKALKEGAKDLAPRSLAIADKNVQDTDAFITGNRHDTAQISTRASETLKSAEHLLKITEDSKSSKTRSSEDLALQLELEQKEVADKQALLNYKESQLEKEEKTNRELAAEQEFKKHYEEALASFTTSEAEVYQQGNTLAIRLKGLGFPSSQAVIKGADFALLAKVQKVLKSFGKTSVIIEGNTDSIEGKNKTKEKLSLARAEAVKEYLLSSSEGQPIDIKAVGYADQKPLASNKTKLGRAQNRRVDVLIMPERY